MLPTRVVHRRIVIVNTARPYPKNGTRSLPHGPRLERVTLEKRRPSPKQDNRLSAIASERIVEIGGGGGGGGIRLRPTSEDDDGNIFEPNVLIDMLVKVVYFCRKSF